MKCPRDQTELIQETLEKKTYMRCPQCEGLFIGLTGPRLQGVILSRLNPKSTPCILTEGEEPLLSPYSNEAMKHFDFKEVKLDYCKASNSVWMDKGELDAIIKKFAVPEKQKNQSNNTSENGFLDGLTDGSLTLIGDIIGGLFDGV